MIKSHHKTYCKWRHKPTITNISQVYLSCGGLEDRGTGILLGTCRCRAGRSLRARVLVSTARLEQALECKGRVRAVGPLGRYTALH